MFDRKCAIIGCVHVLSLPGAAGYEGNMPAIISTAVSDARAYADNGIDALIIENMHDVPYLLGSVEPETTAAMTAVAKAVREAVAVPIGIQILAGANIEALGVAIAASLDFLRVEGFVFAHVGDEGFHQSCAAQLIRRRAALCANNIKIFADIKKKHSSHAITADISLAETAHAAEFFKADGLIVTGSATGVAPSARDVIEVKQSASSPVMVGSGVTLDNLDEFFAHADALIVGSSLKFDSKWENPVDAARVRALTRAAATRQSV